jgi:hypothetical protein
MEAARVRDESAAEAAPAEPKPAPAPIASPKAALRVAETLICAGTGEPMYEEDCADVNARVAFLQRIAQQAAEFGKILPLGAFDRAELQFPDGRGVAQVRADRLIYVRTTSQPATSGTLAGGLQRPNGEVVGHGLEERYPAEAIEGIVRQFENVHAAIATEDSAPLWTTWDFEKAQIRFIPRPDGWLLAIIVRPKSDSANALDAVSQEFLALRLNA